MIETKEKFYTSRNDRVFKEIFMREENKDILKSLLESILKLKISDIKFLNLERNVDNIKVRRKHFDLFLDTDIGKVQVEVNAQSQKYIHPRNAAFIFDIYSHEVKKGEDYTEKSLVVQINLSYKINNEEMIREYKIRDKHNNEFIKNFIIYDINMEKVKDIWYSKSKKEIENNKYLIMLDLDLEELNELSKISKDRRVNKYMDEVKRVNEDPEFREFISAEEDNRKIENSIKKELREDGIKEGQREEKIEIAKNMLSKNMDIKLISEITGLTESEVNALNL